MSKPLVTNAADEGQVQKAAKVEKTERDFELADLKVVMSTPAGRRAMWRLLSWCKAFQTPMEDNPNWTHFNLGRQNVGFFLLGEIEEANFELSEQMRKEARNVRR